MNARAVRGSGELAGRRPSQGTGAGLLGTRVDDVVELWRELVRWDPALPSECSPAVASAVVTAIVEALGRPQPLGWGLDAGVEKVVDVFATATGSVEDVIGQLLCLREALRRALSDNMAAGDGSGAGAGGSGGDGAGGMADLEERVHMIIDRSIARAAVVATERLRDESLTDRRTGLPNRRSLERDLAREVSRADRYGRDLTVVVLSCLDVDWAEGGLAGVRPEDAAGAVQSVIRAGDSAYSSGEHFVLILPNTGDAVVRPVMNRLSQAAVRPTGQGWVCGSGTYPDDGADADLLLSVAEERCGRAAASAESTG